MMERLYMVQLFLDLPALLKFIKDEGLGSRGTPDLGYGIHAWLSAAFGEISPRPWRYFEGKPRPRVLAYSSHSAEVLAQRLKEFATPGVFAVCSDPGNDVSSRPMPHWQPGRLLGFEILCCPVARRSRTGVELDVFLMRANERKGRALSREAVYCDWLQNQLQRSKAVRVESVALRGYRLVRMIRKTQAGSSSAGRNLKSLVRPQALMRGALSVDEPEGFALLLRKGVGRHKAFGHGMLLLRPAP